MPGIAEEISTGIPSGIPGAAPPDFGAGPADGSNGRQAPSPSVTDAAERVVEAVRGVVLDHVALVLLEVRVLGRNLVQGSALALVGAIFLAATWGLAMATLYVFVGDAVAPWMRLAAITLGTGALGGALVASGARRLQRRAPDA